MRAAKTFIQLKTHIFFFFFPSIDISNYFSSPQAVYGNIPVPSSDLPFLRLTQYRATSTLPAPTSLQLFCSPHENELETQRQYQMKFFATVVGFSMKIDVGHSALPKSEAAITIQSDYPCPLIPADSMSQSRMCIINQWLLFAPSATTFPLGYFQCKTGLRTIPSSAD